MKRSLATAALASALTLTCAGLAFAQDQYYGEVRLFGSSFCPRGWLAADGQLMSVRQNSALFSLLRTTYGGDGSTTFALPDLRGRAPVSPAQSSWSTSYGAASVTLTQGQLPAHGHGLQGASQSSTTTLPTGSLLATFPPGRSGYAAGASAADAPMSSTAIGQTGGGQPISTQSPVLAMNWCVATWGAPPLRP